MRQRYTVYDKDQPFASVHADSAEEPVCLGCLRATGHNPKTCKAVLIHRSSVSARLLLSREVDGLAFDNHRFVLS
jgi:hypothetical protein